MVGAIFKDRPAIRQTPRCILSARLIGNPPRSIGRERCHGCSSLAPEPHFGMVKIDPDAAYRLRTSERVRLVQE
jgi:hypothetical protein